MSKLALHWKILIGLALGVVVGIIINGAWSPYIWGSLGVGDAKAFLDDSQAHWLTELPSDPEPALLALGMQIGMADETLGGGPLAPSTNAYTMVVQDWMFSGLSAIEAEPVEGDSTTMGQVVDAMVQDWFAAAATARDANLPPPPTLTLPTDPAIIANLLWYTSEIRGPQPLERNGLDTINADAGFVAKTARFIRNANAFIGDLFLRMLRLIAVPIVLFSLIAGVASLNDTAKLGRIGTRTILLYLCTTAIAITVGLVLANIVRPGDGFPVEIRESLLASSQSAAESKIATAETRPTPWQVALDVVPANPFEAIAKGKMLQVVFTALIVGVGLSLLPRDKAKPVVDFCEAMTEVVIKIVHIALALAPYAVFALIVKVVADLGLDVLSSLAVYSVTVVLGLAIMIFAVYPLGLKIFTKVRYKRFFAAIAPAQLLAFSSASSGATLPVTMECCEENLGVHEEVNAFVLPLGATINMDGTALYQGVAAVFIAQMYGMDLTIADQLTIVLTATLASIGTAAVPGVGIIMLVIVLESVGIPLEGIAVILGVDRILDMCRTTANVTGDAMVCAVVASSENAIDDEDTVRKRLAEKAALDEFTPEEEAFEEAAG
jgi:Na+/H+-dicarboxylate symporter